MIDIISGMSQIIRDPTHFTENSHTLLDLIIVNNVENIDFSSVGDNILASNIRYRCTIYCALKLPKSYPKKSFSRQCNYFRTTILMTTKQYYEIKIEISH